MAEDLSNAVTDSDAALVERIRMGERAAFDTLVRRHQAIVYRVCYRILGEPEDAADATQEALLRAYRKLDTFRGQSAFKTWLMRLTVNVSLNERERRKATLPLDDARLATLPEHTVDLRQAEAVTQIHQALQQVPPNHRAAVVLRDLEGFGYAEVAIALGVPEGTAKGWAHRGRSRLKDLLT
ncbi:MAG TPA: sigma-70 family RNA polymerase sigma factor [Thermomicrobiales bacterium]|jgi:RNA polymerase sigma-70 factor (ECF subfamily)